MELLRPLFINLLTVAAQICVLVAFTYAIKYLKIAKERLEMRMGKEQFEKAQAFVKTIVYAIEQQYPNMAGNKKYESAVAAINEKLGNILTPKEINSLVEAAVCEINLIKKNPGTNKVINITNQAIDAQETAKAITESMKQALNGIVINDNTPA